MVAMNFLVNDVYIFYFAIIPSLVDGASEILRAAVYFTAEVCI